MQAIKGKLVLILIVAVTLLVPLLGTAGMAVSMITVLIGGEEEEVKADTNVGIVVEISAEVENYREQVLEEAKKYDKEQYIDLYLAVMMQESGGRGNDVFQCSESLGYPPNTLSTDASIQQGVKYLSGMLDKASVKSPGDIDNIKLALQGYNFGGSYISFALQQDGKWTQENVNQFAANASGGNVRLNEEAAKNMGMWAYGDQYYTQHVLRYYPLAAEGQGYIEAGEAAKVPLENRMGWLFPNGVPEDEDEMQQYLARIEVEIIDDTGNETTMTLTVHEKLATEIKVIFKEMKELKFKIKTWETAAYNWRPMASDNSKLSYHSYGSCVDINTYNNAAPYTSGTYLPGEDEFALTQEIVNIWKEHGFYWGGDWDGYFFDPMHFTYTNN